MYVMVTPGVQALPDMLGLVQAVQEFDRFTPENDPYGEHDFGSSNWHSAKTAMYLLQPTFRSEHGQK